MDDWRITNQEETLKDVEFRKIVFPDFWIEEYAKKGEFYKMIEKDAIDFVKKHARGQEYLVGASIQEFWHTHCDCCTETITTKDNKECYCTNDFSIWICKTCFKCFKNRFGWKVK